MLLLKLLVLCVVIFEAQSAKTKRQTQGGCTVPVVQNGKVFTLFFVVNYAPGHQINSGETVQVICDENYSLVQVGDNKVHCKDSKWQGEFSECRKLCPGKQVSGRSKTSKCMYDGKSVPCEKMATPDTVAVIKCKPGYNLVDGGDTAVCKENGKWDVSAKCEPTCSKSAENFKVSIFSNSTKNCEGTIISDRLVVTSASCFTGKTFGSSESCLMSPKQFKVAFGQHADSLSSIDPHNIFNVSQVRVASIFGGTGDLGIIVLEHAIDFNDKIAPICLLGKDCNNEFSLFGIASNYIQSAINAADETSDRKLGTFDEKFDVELKTCHRPSDCKVPKIKNGMLHGINSRNHYVTGDYLDQSEALSVSCKDGFFVESDRSEENEISCIKGKWNKRFPHCHKPSDCKIPDIENAKIKTSLPNDCENGHYVNDMENVTVTCTSRFSPELKNENDKFIHCSNSKWSKQFPTCQKFCSPTKIQGQTLEAKCERDGKKVPCDGNLWPGTKAQVVCKTGYKLPNEEPASVTCLENGQWDNKIIRCATVCGNPRSQDNSIYSTSKDSSIEDVPWTALIYKNYRHSATGTILSEKLIISAARHFFIREEYPKIVMQPLEIFKIFVGKHLRDMKASEKLPAQSFGVSDVKAAPTFVGIGQFFFGNMALVVLDKPITYAPNIAPICFDFDSQFSEKIIPPGTVGLASGWGYTADDVQSEVLQRVLMPVGDTNKCEEETGPAYKKFLTPDKFCSGYQNGTGLCNIDPGTGIIFPRLIGDLEVSFIRGVVSNNRISERCNYPFYAFSTDLEVYAPFIKEVYNEYLAEL